MAALVAVVVAVAVLLGRALAEGRSSLVSVGAGDLRFALEPAGDSPPHPQSAHANATVVAHGQDVEPPHPR